MTSIRLLPVVIAAAAALLVLKGLGMGMGMGLLTAGGSVFTGFPGAGTVLAASTPAEPVSESGETTIALPPEPTLTDDSPVLDDMAPTMGATDVEAHGAAPAEPASVAAEHGADDAGAGAVDAAANHDAAAADAAHEDAQVPPVPGIDVAADPRAEGVPMFQNGSGVPVPLAGEGGESLTEAIILERLRARRAELETREAELDMRLELIEAAEAQLASRAAALEALEARINAKVAEQESAEEGQFAAIISMYGQMRPGDAATIFDQLDMQVLVKVARGMSPRKMAPILAKMTPTRAQELTLALAQVATEPAVATAGAEDLSTLPQIVGH